MSHLPSLSFETCLFPIKQRYIKSKICILTFSASHGRCCPVERAESGRLVPFQSQEACCGISTENFAFVITEKAQGKHCKLLLVFAKNARKKSLRSNPLLTLEGCCLQVRHGYFTESCFAYLENSSTRQISFKCKQNVSCRTSSAELQLGLFLSLAYSELC